MPHRSNLCCARSPIALHCAHDGDVTARITRRDTPPENVMHETIDRASDMVKAWMSLAQLATDAQFVVAMRLMGLTGVWHVPDSEKSAMVEEKLPAFTESMVSGTLTALSGRGPDRVMQAILAPISEKASSNRSRLAGHGPRYFGQPRPETD